MLDQNTDRMWYVIGAIVIGAAIIAMGLNIFSESLDSVDGMMANLTGIAGENVASIGGGLYTDDEIDHLINNEGYIPVATADELNNIRKNEMQTFGVGSKWESDYISGLDGKYLLVSNIDFSNFDNWIPIGNSSHHFSGLFDGGGYDIDNLIVSHGSYAGLFGIVDGGIFENISLINIDVNGDGYVGGLVGFQRGNSLVLNTSVEGVVHGSNWRVGGLVGRQDDSIIENSRVDVNVTGDLNNVGGVVGTQTRSSVINSYSIGDVLGKGSATGGLVGISNDSTIKGSYATGAVTGDIRVGGLVGYLYDKPTVFMNNYALGVVDGNDIVGGLVGLNNASKILDSMWANDINIGLLAIGTMYSNGSTANVHGVTRLEIEEIIKNLF